MEIVSSRGETKPDKTKPDNKTAKPQNRKTAKPQNRKTAKPQNRDSTLKSHF